LGWSIGTAVGVGVGGCKVGVGGIGVVVGGIGVLVIGMGVCVGAGIDEGFESQAALNIMIKIIATSIFAISMVSLLIGNPHFEIFVGDTPSPNKGLMWR
jgi:hypothetical protein